MSDKATEGFVYTETKGKRTYYAALKMKTGQVARYPKGGGDGVWCGKKVSTTFVARAWATVTSPEELERHQRFMEEVNRLVPSVNHWRDTEFRCLICGAQVYEQIKHFLYHTDPDHQMRDTLKALFL